MGVPAVTGRCLDWEQFEIPESPGSILVRPVSSIQSCRHSDGDSGAGLSATTAVTQTAAAYAEEDSGVQEQQEREEEEQKWKETNSGGGALLPTRQP